MADKKYLPNVLDYIDKDGNFDKSSFVDAYSEIKSPLDLNNYNIPDEYLEFKGYNGQAFGEYFNNSINSFSDDTNLGSTLSDFFIGSYEYANRVVNNFNKDLSRAKLRNPDMSEEEILSHPDFQSSLNLYNRVTSYLETFYTPTTSNDNNFVIDNLDISPFMFMAGAIIVALCGIWAVRKAIRLYK